MAAPVGPYCVVEADLLRPASEPGIEKLSPSGGKQSRDRAICLDSRHATTCQRLVAFILFANLQ